MIKLGIVPRFTHLHILSFTHYSTGFARLGVTNNAAKVGYLFHWCFSS